MVRDDLTALLPLALGHDQEASASPWVQLTRRTTDYPSRVAQTVLAVARGAIPITPDVVDLIYRSDGCGRWRAWSTLAQPPDLDRALWSARALLVTAGAVPELAPLRANLREFGNVYGDLDAAWAYLGPADPDAGVLFVPGAALLFHDPEAAVAAATQLRRSVGRIDLQLDLVDSGQVLQELGLADEAQAARDLVRRRVVERGYRLVLAGTPKDAWGLQEALAGLPVEVRYAGAAVLEGTPLTRAWNGRQIIYFHPSETLLHRSDDFGVIDRWLGSTLGTAYRHEDEPRRTVWPAAIERPALRVPDSLTQGLAELRLAQLMTLRPAIILTTDPFSRRALRDVVPARFEVVDLTVFAARLAAGEVGGDD